METSGLFIQRLCNFRKIRDLEKFFNQKDYRAPTDDANPSTLGSLVHQKQTHTHLATKAAMSYWQSFQDSIGQTKQLPVKITMSYRRAKKGRASATVTSLKSLTRIH